MSQPSLPVAIAFALELSNPWYEHLGALAEHLGATSYYAILTDKEPLLEALERLPKDIRLITISTTGLEQPTRL